MCVCVLYVYMYTSFCNAAVATPNRTCTDRAFEQSPNTGARANNTLHK